MSFLYKRSDFKHMWWLFKQMIKCGLSGDWEGSKEARTFLKIHLCYNSKRTK
jgi:hypothetical protein